jgi:hypothetical protein
MAFAGQIVSQNRVVVYYFHGDFRCSTCYKMEQYSKEAVETNFKDALASGKLEFKVINVEDRANQHYTKDYQLYTKTLILSLIKDDLEIRWKNMDKIWEYAGNKQNFIGYLKSGVDDFLKECK